MTSKPTMTGSTNRRSRRQRIAIGAVLASTTLLGTYMAAVRPQPTYASPNKGGPGQGQGDATESSRAIAAFVRPACQVTVDDSTALQQAILNSVDDSVICIDGTITLTQPLPSIDDTRLTLRGLSGNSLDDSIVVNRDDSVAVSSILRGTFTTTDDTLTIADLGFNGGEAQLVGSVTAGGAIKVTGAPLVVFDSDFTSNEAVGGSGARGGAIFVQGGDVGIYGSTFTDNKTSNRGGALFVSQGSVTITESEFYGNVGAAGGAVSFKRDGSTERSIAIANSTFTGNTTVSYGTGGAVYSANDAVSLTEVDFISNSAFYGGGAVMSYGDVTASRVSFIGNNAKSGGAVMIAYTSLALSETSFTGNSAAQNGGAVYAKYAEIAVANSYIGRNFATTQAGGIDAFKSTVSLEFATLYDDSAGVASNPASVQLSDGSLTSVGSVIGSSRDDTVLGLASGATVDDTFSVITGAPGFLPLFDGTGSQGVPKGTAGLGPLDGANPGQLGRSPAVSSVLVTGAPGSNLGTGINSDQLGVTRGPNVWTIGARQVLPPPPPPPVAPPTPPTNVTAAPADRSAVVSWAAPASVGSFPVSTYKAMASPGGQSCLVVSPALTCTVTGLANGTPYTFTVQALSGGGWSPSSDPSNVVWPGGDTPAPEPQPLPKPLSPGEALLQVNGVPDPNVTVDPNSQSTGLAIVGDGWSMGLDGLSPEGKPLNLGPDGSLKLQSERDVVTEGTGFLPNSEIDLYMDPPLLLTGSSTRAATEAIYVGTIRTDASGKFAGTATLPNDITPGDHVLQAAGYSPSRQARAMSLGIVVDPSLVLDKGTRKADGRHDRIRTTGSSTGIDGGTRLTPWIRYAGQASFTQGRATITVQSDGTFRWTRQIRKDKGITAYVTYVDAKSNDVFWAKAQ